MRTAEITRTTKETDIKLKIKQLIFLNLSTASCKKACIYAIKHFEYSQKTGGYRIRPK